MPFLQSPSLLPSLALNHGDDRLRLKSAGNRSAQKSVRSASSFANLIHFARNPVEIASEAVEDWYDGSTKEERTRRQVLADRKQLLYLKMRTAADHADWEAAATELDDIEGNNEWKHILESLEYDVSLVQARLKQLDEARISCDVGRMLFLVRTALTRDLGDMGHLRMYKHTHIGTKDLIERYIASALETLDALLDVSAKAKCDGMESKYILEQVLSSRQAFGRSALLLSGGATFGMNHIGVLKALWEAKLLPRIISGASAGSIVCAVLCTRIDEEIPHLMETFCEGDLAVFEEEGNEDGLLRKAARFLTHGALYDISHLKRVMRDLLGDMTFQEAYNRTRKILNICVSSASLYELPRLLNYITAPNVLIWSAVAASCSVPFVYTAAAILAKDPKTGKAVPWNPSPQRWIDGSVDNDIPMTRLAEMFNVNHFIVSQVNPHVVPFLIKDEDVLGEEAKKSTTTEVSGQTWLRTLSHLAKGEALYRMHTLADMGILTHVLTKGVSVLSQKYSGDITILPEISYADFPRMLSNPTKEFMQHAMLSGERATWPKLSIIKNHCAIELALDKAVQKLRARVVFSPDEVELRMNTQKKQSSGVKKSSSDKRTKAKRPISLNSTSSAPLPSRTSLHTHSQSSSGRLAPAIRHKKSRSIETVIMAPTTADDSEGAATAMTPELLSPIVTQDVTSSGAEENSNVTSSSSSTSFSSPTESPSSPMEADTKRHGFRFTSSSQPTTPSLTTPSYFTAARPLSSAAALHPNFSMTPSKSTAKVASSPPEVSRYKRLFHNRPQEQAAPNAPKENREQRREKTSPKSSMKRNWAFEIAIPTATKNLLSRGKKGRTDT